MYAATTKDEGNAADGCFSTACQGGVPWMEEKRELVTCIIKRQNIEENPCREEASTGPINPLPIKNLPMH